MRIGIVCSLALLAACGGRGFYTPASGAAPAPEPAAAAPAPAPSDDSAQAPTCPEGTTLADDGQCYCAQGMTWDGAECVAVASNVTNDTTSDTPSGNTTSTVDDNTTVQVTTTYVAPPPDPGPPANPVWHARFESSAGAGYDSCQAFDSGDRQDANAPDMQQCSSFCTGYFAAQQKCDCEVGPC